VDQHGQDGHATRGELEWNLLCLSYGHLDDVMAI
jgi:hypothetical protein